MADIADAASFLHQIEELAVGESPTSSTKFPLNTPRQQLQGVKQNNKSK